MKRINLIFIMMTVLLISTNITKAQEDNNFKISGKLLTDQRFLLQDQNDWAWNENRLTLNFDKKITDNSKFYSEVWLRNIGLPNISSSA
ncbi:MAG: hypothetical protein KAQ75_09310, partial [Bacteroidales bacterium]|nr:hypothetical protein [Bacteroidales bacterium]